MSVQLQYDPSTSVSNIFDQARALARACTMDDVQPQAVIAAQHLGDLMIVHPDRIGQAVDALGGSESFRIENIKLSMGLSSGGIAAQVRKSTSAIRCFLFATCLSLHMTPDEIGAFLYEMMERAGLLDIVPVSPAQLTSFISTLEGHMKELLSRENVAAASLGPLLDILSSRISSDEVHWYPLDAKAMGDVFLQTFEAIRSEEVSMAELSGGMGAVWLASIFSWLCPSDVSIFSKDRDQKPNKIRVKLILGAWKLRKWYHIKDVETIVLERESSHSTAVCATRSITYSYWRSNGMSLKELMIIGQIVRELLLASYKFVQVRKNADDPHGNDRPIPFRIFCSPVWVKDLAYLHECFGWPATSTATAQESERMTQDIRRIIEAHVAKSTKDLPHTEDLRHTEDFPIMNELSTWISPHCQSLPEVPSSKKLSQASSKSPSNAIRRARKCLDLAVWVAEHLFMEACAVYQSDRRLRLFSMNARSANHPESLLIQVISTGIVDVDAFVRRSLNFISPDVIRYFTPYCGRPLVVSGQGLVAYPLMLRNFSLLPSEAMTVIVQPGCLKWRDTRYTGMVEAIPQNDGSRIRTDEELPMLELYNKQGVSMPWKRLPEEEVCSAELSVSYYQDELQLSAQIVARNPVDDSVLFRETRYFHLAIQNIATAHVAKMEQMSAEALVADTRSLPKCYPIKLLHIHHAMLNYFEPGLPGDRQGESLRKKAESNFRGVLPYTRLQSVSCLLAGHRNISFPLVIQGSASLLECVLQAHKICSRKTISDDQAEYLILAIRPN